MEKDTVIMFPGLRCFTEKVSKILIEPGLEVSGMKTYSVSWHAHASFFCCLTLNVSVMKLYIQT